MSNIVRKKKIKLVKMDGRKEDFDPEKIIRACIAAGVPEKEAKEIVNTISKKVKDGMTTRELRTLILEELEKRNPEWRDNWEFYDRIVKKRITFERGKFVEIEKGHLYLGREVKDIGPKGLSSLKEVKGILKELEEDLEHGIPPKVINSRTWVLFMAVLKTKQMSKSDKEKAIKEINKCREKQGWKPYEVKRPIE